ncbi:protein of unknown function [Georgfuchsia toluolica]|uniref:Uncharacterized protein n=1 Tax=Georgfuchsia toluolica TaxID=424218 RepID=A0A916N132_9PROT|nr:protein of unknown function [Georgfuchsia toluolica]
MPPTSSNPSDIVLGEVDHEVVKLDFSGFIRFAKKVYEPCEHYVGCLDALAEFEFICQDSHSFVVRVRHKYQEFGGDGLRIDDEFHGCIALATCVIDVVPHADIPLP